VAVDDSATTPQGTPVTIYVLNNDTDADGHTLTVASVTQGAHGPVVNNGGDVTYTPDPGFSGADSFTYTVTDAHGGTDTATVTVTVTSINHPPVAGDDSATTPQDTPVTINVLSNDSDPDNDTLTVNSATQGSHGSVTNNGSHVTYTPNSGFTGADSFNYTISDGNGSTDTATVTVTVTTIETLARINAQIDTGSTAAIYIWDNTTGAWATDEDTENPVDGTNHVTSGRTHNIRVAGGHSYCVWVGGNVTYDVNGYPDGWSISTLEGGGEKACGLADAGSVCSVHFTETAN
jgi:uncharacterized protein YdeI (BOF family)